jgi:transcriptional regulator with XRE-family HTH domain
VPHQDSTWRSRLKHERTQLGLTQAQLGLAAGLSTETIRKYESGGRTPTRRHLLDILAALHVPPAQVRPIIASAGFAPDGDPLPSDVLDGYGFSLDEAAAEIERSPWPRFVTGGAMDVVAANRAAERLWGMDVAAELRRRNRAGAHVIPAMAEPWFAGRVANFDELLSVVIGVLKGIPAGAGALDDPTPWAEKVLGALAVANPTAVGPLLDAWEATPPQHVRPRWEYRVVWREAEGEIRFACLVSIANERDGMSFNDWIPADAASHVTLERVLAARSGSPGPALLGRTRGVGRR